MTQLKLMDTRYVGFEAKKESFLNKVFTMMTQLKLMDTKYACFWKKRVSLKESLYNIFFLQSGIISGWGYTEVTKILKPRPLTSDVLREAEIYILPQASSDITQYKNLHFLLFYFLNYSHDPLNVIHYQLLTSDVHREAEIYILPQASIVGCNQ